MMKHLIMISQCLRQLNNFHLLTAIISGLSNSAVLRLKWTRLKLPKQVLKIMEDLEGTLVDLYHHCAIRAISLHGLTLSPRLTEYIM